MSLDRLDSVVIGNRCEVEGCEGLCHKNENRCYEHSPTSLIEALFNENERCKFGGVRCEGRATRVNQHDVLMCETCYNEWQRIQRGNQTPYMTGETPSGYDGGSYHRNINWRALMDSEQEELGEEDCTCNNLDHSQFNEECPLNEEREVCWGYVGPCDNYSVTNIEHPSDGGVVPVCQECYHQHLAMTNPTLRQVPRNGYLRAALGIPPMRRDEGEETE